ncbi:MULTISPECIES: LEA type 2 family protein [unclassified Siphonobacter]|uniref:LEA type 2 family protein n=1 Tax=unclassified Siphonobacter TaxID=2635712 RepID=UPI000CB122CB|nr:MULTISPECIES: LEA type 2 family protein [unclassified Siphonobacter]MDQ1089102.1 LEA14-like dessication related protein [Siphonobacter sp. SORGH_AS_1065]MDR6195279.1 LEA14-like dessication related protein [Siphonobacter sp. SORGH_AS_0500]PKK38266.1 hypothetical protein BWI96_00270 [Siphonobacter sp. SORGH_AS_0500]
MKKIILWGSLLLAAGTLSRCGVNKQIAEAKALGDCRYDVTSADSIYLAGVDIREFKNFEALNPLKFPQLGAALLRQNVPLDARVNLNIQNPTGRAAGINQLEYKVLLTGQEIATGFINERISVAPGSKTQVPIRVSTNAYQLLSDAKTRDSFIQFVQNLAGNKSAKASKLTIKIKPTLSLGGARVNYPGYITIDQEVTNKILIGR